MSADSAVVIAGKFSGPPDPGGNADWAVYLLAGSDPGNAFHAHEQPGRILWQDKEAAVLSSKEAFRERQYRGLIGRYVKAAEAARTVAASKGLTVVADDTRDAMILPVEWSR